MAKFVLFVGLVGVFLSGPAAAVPISWGMDPSIGPVTPVLRVSLWANDGFSEAYSSVDVTTFNSRITGDLSGIISPVLTLDSIEFSFDNLSLDFAIGASNLPVSIAFDGSFGWSGISGASTVLGTTDPFSTSGTSVDGQYSGSLQTPFGLLPFDVAGPSIGSPIFSTLRNENQYGFPFVSYSGAQAILDFTATDQASLGCRYFSGDNSVCSSAVMVGASGYGVRHTLGSIGGVTWGIGMNPIVGSFQEGLAVYTPEPSTALLLGIGLAGLAARKRV